MKHQLFFIIFILSGVTSYPADVKFYNINNIYGISMRETASVCKDDNGFIWTSSKTGVLRLAGNDHRIYSLPYQTTDIINVKLAYKNKVLFAYTNNGQVFCYNTLSDRFDFLFHASRMLKNRHLYVSSLLIDQHGCFWLATSWGLYKYSEENLLLFSEGEVLCSADFDKDHFLFAKNDGIWLMDIKTGSSVCLYKNEIFSNIEFSSLYYDDAANRLWIGTLSGGLFYYDNIAKSITSTFVRFFPKQPILAIEACSDSTLLVGIDGQGIWEIDKKGGRVLNVYKENVDDLFSLRGNGVYDIFCDENKRIWVCTYSGGLSFFEQTSPIVNQIVHQVNNANSLSNNNVNKVIEDRRGNLWFATDNGICCWDRQSNQWKTYYHNKQEQTQVFLSLCEDNQGRIWAGSFSSGVYVIDGKTGKEEAHYSKDTKETSFAGNFIFDIYKDSDGDLWFGGVMGDIICYVSKENKFKSYPSLPVYAFSELSPTQMLAACTFGLCSLDKQTGKSEILLDGYLLKDILFLDGNAWLCTSGDGLIRFHLNNKTTEKFTVESGLPSDYVNSIMQANGYLWLGTENGLCRFNLESDNVQTYSSILALSNVSFNNSSHYKLHDGQLIFGANKGAILFDPEALQQIQPQGQIFFQELTVSGRSVRDSYSIKLEIPLDSLQEITLKYNQNNLALEILPLGNIASEAKFSWKMEGQDLDWTQASNHHILTYTNIPAGRYLLKIRMYDSSLSQMIVERQLLIRITPPFWQTAWFRLLTLFLVAGIGYFSLRYYIDRLKQRHTEDKVRFFANTAHDIRTSLTLIKAPVEELNKERDLSELGKHYLCLATEQIRRLSAVVTQLLDFQKVDIGKGQLSLAMVDIVKLVANRRLMFESFAKSKNIELSYTFVPSIYLTAIDESMMEKVIDNLISNAVKYSIPDSQVKILFDGSARYWTLEVKDQGIGISKKAQKKLFREFYRSENAVNSKIVGSGIGLLLAKNYVALHGGTISCVSQENTGSCFKITIPFKKVAEKGNPVHTTGFITIPEPVQSVRQEANRKPYMRVLIVEDNDDLRNFMKYPLMEDFDVQMAEDGEQAWKIIQKQLIDLVVSDVMMPKMDGFELCYLMKSTCETSHIPIILLTSLTEKTQQLHGLGLGADDYLTKPFDMTLLTQRIKSIIQNRKTVREKALKIIKEDRDEPIFFNELNDRFVKKAVEVVHRHIADPEFGKEEFALAMNVSSSLLYKKIKSFTDQSPVDFIKSIRLNHAMELLQLRKCTVTEVSELCGFSSVGYFSTVFRKHFGKSPTEI
jgi:signal transduction histidine kinase/DNA-binding response OmpR family regulator/ligand-binding sensor domain-containing protein